MDEQGEIASDPELLQFIHRCPVGIVKFAPNGRIDMINAMATELFVPFSGSGTLDNLFALFSDWFPDLPGVVNGFEPESGLLFEQRRVQVGYGPRQRVLSMTASRIASTAFMAVIQDVTEAALRERRIFEDQQRYLAIVGHVQDYAIYTLDLDGRIQDWNRSLFRLGGWTADDIVGKHVSIFFPPGEFDANAAGQVLTRAARRGSVEIEGRRVRRDGSAYWGDAVVTALPDRDGIVTGFVVISRDVSDRKEREDELVRLATTDPLTGAFNRRFGTDRLTEMFERYRRYGSAASGLMVDIDHFKKVNDGYGHDRGDVVLRGLAQTLREMLRKLDVVARWGGEEFLVLMPETQADRAARVGQRIIQAVRKRAFETDQGPIAITVSIGLATTAPDVESVDALIKRADNALYAAKAAGRDRLVSA